MSLEDEFLGLLQKHPEGLPDSVLSSVLGDRYEEIVSVINDFVATNRLQISTIKTGSGPEIIYKYFQEDLAQKFQGLGPEQYNVYQVIELSGNKGVWTRDIKLRTNIQQQVLNKTLKILEQRKLIKSVRSVMSKSKKLYMLYDLEPSKEVSGGPWYTDQDFDIDFVERLSEDIVNFIRKQNIADLNAISNYIRISGISKVELTVEELELVVATLVYDGRIEEVQGSVLYLTGQHHRLGSTQYKVCKSFGVGNSRASAVSSYFTQSPCGICPMLSRCSPGGIISPERCEYFTQWFDSGETAETTLSSEKSLNNDALSW